MYLGIKDDTELRSLSDVSDGDTFVVNCPIGPDDYYYAYTIRDGRPVPLEYSGSRLDHVERVARRETSEVRPVQRDAPRDRKIDISLLPRWSYIGTDANGDASLFTDHPTWSEVNGLWELHSGFIFVLWKSHDPNALFAIPDMPAGALFERRGESWVRVVEGL